VLSQLAPLPGNEPASSGVAAWAVGTGWIVRNCLATSPTSRRATGRRAFRITFAARFPFAETY
jgi:hypothetical protein